MRMKRATIPVVGVVVMSVVLVGCRDQAKIDAAQPAKPILYQTYAVDGYKGDLLDTEAALTFNVDGTYTIGHITGLVRGGGNVYEKTEGTWEVADGVLQMTNPEGELVGNAEGTVVADPATWGEWGTWAYDNGDSTTTTYTSTYAFEEGEAGDFVLHVDDQTYYYWGTAGHVSSVFTHTFSAEEFLDAFNEETDEGLTSLSVEWGTGSPLSFWDGANNAGLS